MPTYCYRQIGTGDKRIGTFSFWVKRGNTKVVSGGQQWFWNNYGPGSFSGSTDWLGMRFTNDSELEIVTWDGNNGFIKTNAKFRDSSAWYHIVARIDTTQSTNTDRIRLYVNGEQITSVAGGATYPSQNHDYNCLGSSGAYQLVGARATGTTASPTYGEGFDGYITQAIYCQGQSLAPTSFGSTNANGIWVPNSQPSVTYGSQGFKLDFSKTGTTANASGFGADSSGNGNHMTSAGLGTNPSTADTCQNNFVTWNPIANSSFTSLSKGSLVATGNTASNNGNSDATQAPLGGKWYWEGKFVTAASSSSGNYPNIGVYPVNLSRQPKDGGGNAESGFFTGGCSYKPDGSRYKNNSTSSYGGAWSTNDIIGVALDMENFAVYFSKNGTFQDSGNPASGASKTGAAQTWTAAEGAYVPAVSSYNNSVIQFNFGNSPFTIASGNADPNGYGSFEYAPPSGYYALCTKNLALYGG